MSTVADILVWIVWLIAGWVVGYKLTTALLHYRRSNRGRHRRTPSHLDRARARIRARLPARVQARLDSRDASRARRALERAGARIGIGTHERVEPIRAWRAITVAQIAGRYGLFPRYTVSPTLAALQLVVFSTAQNREITLDDIAKCGIGRDHRPPYPNCTCGFYAMKVRPDWPGEAVAEVELFGVVIEHEKGWRAERQRIISIELPVGVDVDPIDVANSLGCQVTKAKVTT